MGTDNLLSLPGGLVNKLVQCGVPRCTESIINDLRKRQAAAGQAAAAAPIDDDSASSLSDSSSGSSSGEYDSEDETSSDAVDLELSALEARASADPGASGSGPQGPLAALWRPEQRPRYPWECTDPLSRLAVALKRASRAREASALLGPDAIRAEGAAGGEEECGADSGVERATAAEDSRVDPTAGIQPSAPQPACSEAPGGPGAAGRAKRERMELLRRLAPRLIGVGAAAEECLNTFCPSYKQRNDEAQGGDTAPDKGAAAEAAGRDAASESGSGGGGGAEGAGPGPGSARAGSGGGGGGGGGREGPDLAAGPGSRGRSAAAGEGGGDGASGGGVADGRGGSSGGVQDGGSVDRGSGHGEAGSADDDFVHLVLGLVLAKAFQGYRPAQLLGTRRYPSTLVGLRAAGAAVRHGPGRVIRDGEFEEAITYRLRRRLEWTQLMAAMRRDQAAAYTATEASPKAAPAGGGRWEQTPRQQRRAWLSLAGATVERTLAEAASRPSVVVWQGGNTVDEDQLAELMDRFEAQKRAKEASERLMQRARVAARVHLKELAEGAVLRRVLRALPAAAATGAAGPQAGSGGGGGPDSGSGGQPGGLSLLMLQDWAGDGKQVQAFVEAHWGEDRWAAMPVVVGAEGLARAALGGEARGGRGGGGDGGGEGGAGAVAVAAWLRQHGNDFLRRVKHRWPLVCVGARSMTLALRAIQEDLYTGAWLPLPLPPNTLPCLARAGGGGPPPGCCVLLPLGPARLPPGVPRLAANRTPMLQLGTICSGPNPLSDLSTALLAALEGKAVARLRCSNPREVELAVLAAARVRDELAAKGVQSACTITEETGNSGSKTRIRIALALLEAEGGDAAVPDVLSDASLARLDVLMFRVGAMRGRGRLVHMDPRVVGGL